MTDKAPEDKDSPPWWKAPWEFLVETLVGVFIFVVIGGAAVGLNFLVHELENNQIDGVITFGLKTAEYALFLVDLVLFGRFLWKTASRTWRKL